MTTETPRPASAGNARVLLATGAVAVLVGVLVTALGALIDGSAGLWGGLLGTGLAVGVLWGGASVVDVVAGLMPSMSLLVALLTYALQVVLMGLVLLVVRRSGVLDSSVDAGWLAGSIIAVTATWIVAQIAIATRRRIPVYDLEPGSRS